MLGKIGFVTTEQSGIPVEFTGRIPDPIFSEITNFTIKANDFISVHYRIYMGNSAPGEYEGRFHIRGEGGEAVIPLKCKIFNFSIPKRSSLKTIFSFDMKAYSKWYKLSRLSLEDELSIHNFLLDYRICGAELYGRNISPSLEILPKLQQRVTSIIIPMEADESMYPDSLSKIKSLGLNERVYFYAYDELSNFPDRFLEARTKMSTLQKKYPELKRMQTSFPIPELRGMFDVWCPLFYHFGRPEEWKKLKSMKKAGKEIWWYAADLPQKPCPNFFIDFPIFDCRIIGILSYLYQVDGLLYWRSNREWLSNLDFAPEWKEEQWRTYIYHQIKGYRKYRNGMGNLVYPGKNRKLLSSLRLENLRDGLEDYEYLVKLKQLIIEGKQIGCDKDFLAEAEKILVIPDNVAQAINRYSGEPAYLMNYRDRLADAIEKLSEKINEKKVALNEAER